MKVAEMVEELPTCPIPGVIHTPEQSVRYRLHSQDVAFTLGNLERILNTGRIDWQGGKAVIGGSDYAVSYYWLTESLEVDEEGHAKPSTLLSRIKEIAFIDRDQERLDETRRNITRINEALDRGVENHVQSKYMPKVSDCRGDLTTLTTTVTPGSVSLYILNGIMWMSEAERAAAISEAYKALSHKGLLVIITANDIQASGYGQAYLEEATSRREVQAGKGNRGYDREVFESNAQIFRPLDAGELETELLTHFNDGKTRGSLIYSQRNGAVTAGFKTPAEVAAYMERRGKLFLKPFEGNYFYRLPKGNEKPGHKNARRNRDELIEATRDRYLGSNPDPNYRRVPIGLILQKDGTEIERRTPPPQSPTT